MAYIIGMYKTVLRCLLAINLLTVHAHMLDYIVAWCSSIFCDYRMRRQILYVHICNNDKSSKLHNACGTTMVV